MSRLVQRAAALHAGQGLLQDVEVFQHHACPTRHATQRLIGHIDLHFGLFGQALGQPFQQGAATGQRDAVLHQIGHQLGRRLIDRLADRLHDDAHRTAERLAQLHAADVDGFRQAGDQVAAADFHGELRLQRIRRPGLDLDPLGHLLADEQVVLLPAVVDDILIHLIARDADRARHDDAAQRGHRHLGGAAADVHDHAPERVGDGQGGADGRGHRLFDQIRLARAGAERGVVYRALLHLGHAAGDADDHAWPRYPQDHAAVHLVDEVVQHLLGDIEVRDDPVAQRPDGDDVARRPAHHLLGLRADGQHPLGSAVNGDHRRLVDHDAAVAHVNQGVGSPQVDADVERKQAEKPVEWAEHALCAPELIRESQICEIL